MKSLSAQNVLYEQKKRNMKKKHKQLRELRKKNGNSSLFGKSGTPKDHNAVDYSMYNVDYIEEYSYVS